MAVPRRLLRRFPFFNPLSDAELEAFAPNLNLVHLPARAPIFRDGEAGDRFYLLVSGTVHIFKQTRDGDVILSVLEPGDHFGEMSLLDGKPRSATARAATDAAVIEIDKPLFLSLVNKVPLVLYQAARVSDDRLRQRDLDLISRLTTHNERLRQLYDTSLDISRHLELPAVLSAIAERANALVRSRRSELYLVDRTGRWLVSTTGKRCRPGQRAPGQAFSSGMPVIRNGGTEHALAAPVQLDNQSLGVLTVFRPGGQIPFTPDDGQVLSLLANQAAIAIENARLFQLAVEKGRIDGELNAARQAQSSLIPRRPPRLPGFRIAGLWRPAHEMAGDFYDFFSLGRRRWAIVIADVSDKGVAAALYMGIARSILRASLTRDADPARALENANRILSEDYADGTFVTVFVAVLDALARRMDYVNAGHNPPLFWRARQRRLGQLGRHGLALGIAPEYAYQAHAHNFDQGDTLLLYTDGVTDAGDAHQRPFGEARLRRLVRDCAQQDANSMVGAIDRAVQQYAGDSPLGDDVTVVAVQCAGRNGQSMGRLG